MKTIIVATDFYTEAENATDYAAFIAKELGAKIILYSLQNISIHTLNSRLPGSSFDQMIFQGHQMIAEAAKDLSEQFDLEVIPHLATGDFYEEIERCIVQYSADLVVLGMPQKSLEQNLLGNTTTKAIDQLSIPILAVPLGARYNGFGKILFACDVMREVHKNILDEVRELATVFNAEVELFHVQNKIEAIKKEDTLWKNFELIKQEFEGIRYFYKGVASKKIIEAIRTEIVSAETNLLIMVTHRYGFWNSLVHRSKTREMAAGEKIPLLSLPV